MTETHLIPPSKRDEVSNGGRMYACYLKTVSGRRNTIDVFFSCRVQDITGECRS